MEFLNEYLPESFSNVILDVSFEPNLHFQSVIRSSISNIKDCDAWVAEFGQKSKTKWNVRHTKPQASRFVCRKKYVCHHSNFQKRPNEGNGRKSKNFSCEAFINIRVKSTTCDTKKKDKYVRNGLPAIIIMNNCHSHDTIDSAALSYLPPTNEVYSEFENYFNNGLGIQEAIQVHESKLQLLGVEDLTDSSINPKYDTVKYWLSNWRKDNLVSQQEDIPLYEHVDSEYVMTDNNDKRKFREFVDLMETQNERFGTPQVLLSKVIKRLKVVNSKQAWYSFLNSAGNNLISHKRKTGNHSMSLHENCAGDTNKLFCDMPSQSTVYIVKATRDNSSFEDLPNSLDIKSEI